VGAQSCGYVRRSPTSNGDHPSGGFIASYYAIPVAVEVDLFGLPQDTKISVDQ